MNALRKYKYTFVVPFVIPFVVLVLSVITAVASAQEVRHVIWDKTPISVNLPIGHEKIISFPASVQPFLPGDLLNQGVLKAINNNGTLYLIASAPFSNKMAEIKLNDANGNVILLNLSASKTASQDQMAILLSKTQLSTQLDSQQQGAGRQGKDKSIGEMVRWVAQQLYAPKRLLTRPNWIVRTPMRTERFVPLYRGGVVSAMPLESWRSGDNYITAVLLRNTQKSRNVALKHTMIRGSWAAVSFFRISHLNPAVLTPVRTSTDSTTAIMVSSVPFDEALKEGSNHV